MIDPHMIWRLARLGASSRFPFLTRALQLHSSQIHHDASNSIECSRGAAWARSEEIFDTGRKALQDLHLAVFD